MDPEQRSCTTLCLQSFLPVIAFSFSLGLKIFVDGELWLCGRYSYYVLLLGIILLGPFRFTERTLQYVPPK